MDLVSSADVGPVSLDRMAREGIVVPLGPGFGAPVDLPVIRADRARPLSGVVPGHTVVSGLAGLWIHSGGCRPRDLDLVGARGLHRLPPGSHPPGWILRFHSGAAALEPAEAFHGVRVAGPARCAVDSLRWDELGRAIPMVVACLRSGAVKRDEVAALVAGESRRGAGASRARNAWSAIEQALGSA
jgi:hypothetical protein